MKSCVIVFPGSNCDRDVAIALEASSGAAPQMIWHGETEIPECDLIVLPGGFSYGDYLRSGAMAARAPIMRSVVAKANAGTPVLGLCNGFQILTEAGLLPGALMRNAGLKFICRDVYLKVENSGALFTRLYSHGQIVRIPISHHDGNYFTDAAALDRLESAGRVAFRYCAADGAVSAAANPNGSLNNIAGILNGAGNVLGMMPHPERLIAPELGGSDGRALFDALAEALQCA
ncbi:MAG: phosphoribosylformylglycinamidine synthase subunit PurQ [Alphaproteobacteria bacterium]